MRITKDTRTAAHATDPRSWIIFMDLREGRYLILGDVWPTAEDPDKLSVAWLVEGQPMPKYFATAEGAIQFCQFLEDHGVVFAHDEVNVGLADVCSRCLGARISPYKEPPQGEIICPRCREYLAAKKKHGRH